MRQQYSKALLTRFYNELMIPYFPLEEERDELDDWIYCLENEKEEHNNGPAMDVLILVCHSNHVSKQQQQDDDDDDDDDVDTMRTLGGIAVEYYKRAQTGLLSYIVISSLYRKSGIASYLHKNAVLTLQQLHETFSTTDSNSNNGEEYQPLKAILAETNTIDAGDAPPEIIQKRHEILYALGYRQLEFPYLQPELGEGLEPFEPIMLLILCDTGVDKDECNDGTTAAASAPFMPCSINDNTNTDDNNYTSTTHNDENTTTTTVMKTYKPGQYINTTILFEYVQDFYMSVFGYEHGEKENYIYSDYYKLASWFTKTHGKTKISDGYPPWLDVKERVRNEYNCGSSLL
uniref:Uncharacterized protein n=1 Tax=Ditylum brightwellii TaxID=49249 RepID=A0A7S2EEU4_9STRA|mmetsp:Transcript_27357/g.40673  ORF Transcript_27357/g.40673 Transcript_27357/m.40673 type:complete len:346 (+) Transcript_27357:751-1788(+)